MICPRCGRRVPDGTLVCPHCHASTDVTQKISLDDLSWCPSCGALVAAGTERCPKCGYELVSEPPARPVRNLDLPEIDDGSGADDAAQTGVMTRIESAIPAADDEASPGAARDRMPRTRAFALAALLAVAVVGGAAILITHPWDPTASQTKATEPADTSMSGFPGVVESLSGQDGKSTTATTSGDDDDETDEDVQLEPDEALLAYHEQLATLADEVDECEQTLRDACEGTASPTASDELASAQQTSIAVSNLIATIEAADDADGTLTEDREHLETLGNWLRNRCDALTDAWELLADADDVSSVSSLALAQVESSADYRELFEEYFDAWEPATS